MCHTYFPISKMIFQREGVPTLGFLSQPPGCVSLPSEDMSRSSPGPTSHHSRARRGQRCSSILPQWPYHRFRFHLKLTCPLFFFFFHLDSNICIGDAARSDHPPTPLPDTILRVSSLVCGKISELIQVNSAHASVLMIGQSICILRIFKSGIRYGASFDVLMI